MVSAEIMNYDGLLFEEEAFSLIPSACDNQRVPVLRYILDHCFCEWGPTSRWVWFYSRFFPIKNHEDEGDFNSELLRQWKEVWVRCNREHEEKYGDGDDVCTPQSLLTIEDGQYILRIELYEPEYTYTFALDSDSVNEYLSALQEKPLYSTVGITFLKCE